MLKPQIEKLHNFEFGDYLYESNIPILKLKQLQWLHLIQQKYLAKFSAFFELS